MRRTALADTTPLFDTLVAAVSIRLALPVSTYDAHFDVLRAARWYPDTTRREP